MRMIDADELAKTLDVGIADAPLYIQATVQQYIDCTPTLDPVHAAGACYCWECKYQDECICRIEFIGRNPILEQNTYEYHPLQFCSFGQRRKED